MEKNYIDIEAQDSIMDLQATFAGKILSINSLLSIEIIDVPETIKRLKAICTAYEKRSDEIIARGRR